MINLRHSVRDDVLRQMRSVGRLCDLLRVRRASRFALAEDDLFFLFFASASLSMARAAIAWASRSSMSSEDDPSNE